MPRRRVGGGKPDRSVRGVDDGAVTIHGEALVNRRINLAVAVGIEVGRTPALGLLRVSCLIKDPSVEPAESLPARSAKEKRVVLVEAELEMVRVKAGIDGSEFLRLGIVDGGVLARCCQWKIFGKWRIRSGLAEIRILGRADVRGHPNSALLIHHWIVRSPHAVPQDLIPVEWRGNRDLLWPRRPHGGPVGDGRNPDGARGILNGIDPQEIIIVEVGAVNGAVGVYCRVALVGADLVMRMA